jgi:hypothetical protein
VEEERSSIKAEKQKLETASLKPEKTKKPLPSKFQETLREGPFVVYINGIIYDHETELEWAIGPKEIVTLDDSIDWIENLSIGGNGWRMPTIAELKTLYEDRDWPPKGIPSLKRENMYYWTNEKVMTHSGQGAWTIKLGSGSLKDCYKSIHTGLGCLNTGVMAVRSRDQESKTDQPEEKVASISPEPISKSPVTGIEEVARDGQYIKYANGIVYDTETDLEWLAGPDKDIKWYDAKKWAENLNIDGEGWRMPTVKELETLYKHGLGTRNMTPLLKNTG